MPAKYRIILLCTIALIHIASGAAAVDETMEQVDVLYLTLRDKIEGKYSTQ